MSENKAHGKEPVKLFIGIPVNSGQMMMSTVLSLLRTVQECHEAGWGFPLFEFRIGDSDLCRARNAIVSRFLKSDCTDLLLIDSDISWNYGHIKQIVSHKKDFIAAAYRGKTDDRQLYFIQWPEKKEMFIDPDVGIPLMKIDGISIGFCRLTRSCVEKLVESLNGHHFIDPLYPDEVIHWLIDFEKENGVRMEEGYSLCRRWRRLGGDLWLDPTINLGHMGYKVFDGNIIDYLDSIRGIILNQNLSSARELEELLTDKLTPQFMRDERKIA